jgi:hypothetical protein
MASALARRQVAADNNCLFTTCAYLCEGLTSELELRAAARRLRVACAEAVLADPDPSMRALLLGHDTVGSYDAWIRFESHWGGEPEVLMLAQHFGVEIVLTSCETLRSSTYASATPSARIFILYTGQHYGETARRTTLPRRISLCPLRCQSLLWPAARPA